MISYDFENGRFNLRAVAAIIRDGSVLVHRAETDDFWALPGGRVEPFEPTEETLRREMLEEMGCAVRVERLVWIVENFFQYAGKPHHEIAFYYLASLESPVPEKLNQPSFEGWEEDPKVRLLFEWMPLEGLDAIPLYPTFLRKGLARLPEATQHIVHVDSEAGDAAVKVTAR